MSSWDINFRYDMAIRQTCCSATWKFIPLRLPHTLENAMFESRGLVRGDVVADMSIGAIYPGLGIGITCSRGYIMEKSFLVS